MRMNNIIYLAGAVGIIMIATFAFLFNSIYFQTAFIVALLVIFSPILLMNYLEYKRAKLIEFYFADFLRDVAESNRSGMTLEKSIESAVGRRYGPLKEEIRIISSQISWGLSFEEALLKFSKRVKSGLVRQTVKIIVEAYRLGGDMAGVLETVSEDVRTIKEIEAKRRNDLRVYVISIYFIFLMFLAIILVLSKSFIPATPQLGSVSQLVGGTASNVSEEDFKTYFLHLSLIEAFFAGLVAGQMGEGSLRAGFKHSIVLIIVTLIAFQIFLAPAPFAAKLASDIARLPPQIISATSEEMPYTILSDTTAQDVASRVKEITKNNPAWEGLSKEEIMFAYSNCKPCERGDLLVQSDSIIVKKPAKILYSISIGEGRYTINIRGVQ